MANRRLITCSVRITETFIRWEWNHFVNSRLVRHSGVMDNSSRCNQLQLVGIVPYNYTITCIVEVFEIILSLLRLHHELRILFLLYKSKSCSCCVITSRLFPVEQKCIWRYIVQQKCYTAKQQLDRGALKRKVTISTSLKRVGAPLPHYRLATADVYLLVGFYDPLGHWMRAFLLFCPEWSTG